MLSICRRLLSNKSATWWNGKGIARSQGRLEPKFTLLSLHLAKSDIRRRKLQSCWQFCMFLFPSPISRMPWHHDAAWLRASCREIFGNLLTPTPLPCWQRVQERPGSRSKSSDEMPIERRLIKQFTKTTMSFWMKYTQRCRSIGNIIKLLGLCFDPFTPASVASSQPQGCLGQCCFPLPDRWALSLL